MKARDLIFLDNNKIMKRALAERAKQSGLPNGVGLTPVALQEKSLPTSTPPNNNNTSSIPGSASSSGNSSISINNRTVSRLQVPPSSSLPPPQKISKVNIKPTTTSGGGGGSIKVTTQSPRPTSTAASTSSPRPKKRSRESPVKLEDEDEDDSNATSFYLRHQNRALASELRSVKYQLVRLERERDYRRTQSMQAVQSLNTLHSIWESVESALEQQRHTGIHPMKMEISNDVNIDAPVGAVPLSTGSGKSVEWIDALMNSLTRIGTKKTSSELSMSKIKGNDEESNNGVSNDDDKMDVASESVNNNEEKNGKKTAEELEDQKNIEDTSKLSNNMVERVSLLQSWIWSLLQNLEKSNNPPLNGESSPSTSNSNSNGTSWSTPSTMELQNQVSKAEAENVTLLDQLKEMARSRDEMVESDRRVRRGLYRLAAGRMNLKEVLKAVANEDEDKDKESAANWMEGNPRLPQIASSSSISSSLLSPNSKMGGAENVKLENDGKTMISSHEVEQLKKQVSDLNTLATSRDEQIKKVSSHKSPFCDKLPACPIYFFTTLYSLILFMSTFVQPQKN
jgi:hypothetical protein